FQPLTDDGYQSARRSNSTPATRSGKAEQGQSKARPVAGQILTQHTGLPPRAGTAAKPRPGSKPYAQSTSKKR
ncbi:MAG: hypothetical protein RLZZ22_1427, partial [Pseudomonadota bacterium]